LGSAEIASWLQPGLAVGEKLSDGHSLFSTFTVLSPNLAQDKQELSKSNKLKSSLSYGRQRNLPEFSTRQRIGDLVFQDRRLRPTFRSLAPFGSN
jgi:hypothetical protein